MALDGEASDTSCLLLSQSPPFRSLFTDTYYYYNTPPPLSAICKNSFCYTQYKHWLLSKTSDFRLRPNVSSPSLTSDFSIQKSLLKKTSSVGSFLLFNDCRRIRSFLRRSSAPLHSTATAYRHRRLRWFLHPDRNGYHGRGQGSCRRRIPTSRRRGRS